MKEDYSLVYCTASRGSGFNNAAGRGVKQQAGNSQAMMETISSASQLETASSNSVGSILESVSSFASLATTNG